MKSYYDIDGILAEEESITCTSLYDFSHLSHLDPDYIPPRTTGENRKRGRRPSTFLPENSQVKMPLWSAEKWAKLGFVRLSIPRHFGRKARERLTTDPGSADLRSKNERYFSSGARLVNLIEECTNILPAKAKTSNKNRRRVHIAAMKDLFKEAKELRQTLLITFTGERLRRVFDWTLGSVGDDVSMFTKRLTELELNLFLLGASASSAHDEWKNFGSKKIPVSSTMLATGHLTPYANSCAAEVTPEKNSVIEGSRKRKRPIES